MTSTPFVVGQWVRGEKFYGRTALIEEVLRGHRDWLWLLGTRRIGKTSLLKQVEYVTGNPAAEGYLPIFWDFQGAETPEELHELFQDALLDAEDRLQALEIRPADAESAELFGSLGRLRRKVRGRGRKLLLLCDEAEALIKIQEKDPGFLDKLRRSLQSQDDIRSVLASTIRLWVLADVRGDTSPFLHGFAPPLYINRLRDDEARALIRQDNLPEPARPAIAENDLERIRVRCDGHPYLIQLVGRAFMELGDLEESLEHVAADPMVSYFFSVDFEMLSAAERATIQALAAASAADSKSVERHVGADSSEIRSVLQRLEQLGYIRRNADGRFELVNFFFRRWMQQRPLPTEPAPGAARAASLTAHSVGDEPELFAGRYRLLQAVGEGATGTVYRTRDTVLNETIALKLLRAALCEQPEILARFRQEILFSRDLNHPNVVRTYYLGEHDGRWYLTMQWIGGPTLAERIHRQGPLGAGQAVVLACKLASALAAAHGKKVIHRDLKPHNVLLDENEEPYLSDFGLSRLRDAPGVTRAGVFLGTPDYASPEQAALGPLDERSDIYSLGTVLFYMMTGRKPFVADSLSEVLRMHRQAAPPDPRAIRRDLPDPCARLVLRCLQKDPAERFQSAGELCAALEACRVS